MAARQTHFLVNLRTATASAAFRRRLRPPGYLVPPAYLTGGLARSARAFSRRGETVVADNGLFDDITRFAQALAGRRRDRRLAATAARLASTVDPIAHLEEQMAVEPSAIIGVEDITAALWLRLGLPLRTIPRQRAAIRARNRRVAKRARALASRVPQRCAYLPVASAQDYDSAFDAGREFASAGLTAAAMGFGAFMSEDTSTRSIKFNGRDVKLEVSMPTRYLSTALVARGFWDGWKAVSNQPPRQFHFLGLGAPIMLGIVSCAASQTPVLTFDATSPIKDAAQGTVYVSKPAHLKIRTWKAAARLTSNPGERWRCPCPFCRSFARDHPFDYERGLEWRRRHPRAALGPPALRSGRHLFKAYPLLGQPTATPLGREITFARVGHNHWALQQVAGDLHEARRRGAVEAYVEEVVDAYEGATPLRNYAAGVRRAFEIARGNWP